MFNTSGMETVFTKGANVDILGGIGKAIDLFTPDINYSYLRDVATYKELQADALEVQVAEQVNMIRQNFIESIGAYQTATAQRGFKVGEGSSAKNMEMSAIELGKDVQTADKNVKYKQGQLRRSAKTYRATADQSYLLGMAGKLMKKENNNVWAYL